MVRSEVKPYESLFPLNQLGLLLLSLSSLMFILQTPRLKPLNVINSICSPKPAPFDSLMYSSVHFDNTDGVKAQKTKKIPIMPSKNYGSGQRPSVYCSCFGKLVSVVLPVGILKWIIRMKQDIFFKFSWITASQNY